MRTWVPSLVISIFAVVLSIRFPQVGLGYGLGAFAAYLLYRKDYVKGAEDQRQILQGKIVALINEATQEAYQLGRSQGFESARRQAMAIVAEYEAKK